MRQQKYYKELALPSPAPVLEMPRADLKPLCSCGMSRTNPSEACRWRREWSLFCSLRNTTGSQNTTGSRVPGTNHELFKTRMEQVGGARGHFTPGSPDSWDSSGMFIGPFKHIKNDKTIDEKGMEYKTRLKSTFIP